MRNVLLVGAVLSVGLIGCGGDGGSFALELEWVEYESETPKFTVDFPIEPEVENEKATGRTIINMGIEDTGLLLIYFEEPMTPDEQVAFIERSKERQYGDGMKVVSTKELKRNGHPAVLVTEEGEVTVEGAETKPYKQIRLALNGNGYTFYLKAEGDLDGFDDAVAMKFLDSFQPEAGEPVPEGPQSFDEHGFVFQYSPGYEVESGVDGTTSGVTISDARDNEVVSIEREDDPFLSIEEELAEQTKTNEAVLASQGEEDFEFGECKRTILGEERTGVYTILFPDSTSLTTREEIYFISLGEKSILQLKLTTQWGSQDLTKLVDLVTSTLELKDAE